MRRPLEAPLAFALLGVLASGCQTPEADETNDELGTETTDGESDGSTDGETESGTSSSTDGVETTETETTETDDTSSSSSSSSDTADTLDGAENLDTADQGETGDGFECECIAEQPDYEEPMLPVCGEPLCEIVRQEEDWEGLPVVATPEALECALTALRDRTPGYIRWSSFFNGGQFSDDGYVLIYDNGEAVRREWGANDLDYDVDPALLFALPDPSHYEACLANPDANERYYCMREYPNPSIAECEAGWTETSG